MIQAPPPDSLRAALREVFARSAYDWREGSRPFDLLRRWSQALVDRLAGLEASYPGVLRWIVWGLVVVLALIALHAVWLLVRTVRAAPRSGTAPSAASEPVRRDAAWFRREAVRFAAAGRYPAAVQAEFVGLVLELDARELVRFHPSKTPREYVPELARTAAAPDGEFVRLVDDLYRYAFAGVPCGPDEYAGWRARAVPERYAPAR